MTHLTVKQQPHRLVLSLFAVAVFLIASLTTVLVVSEDSRSAAREKAVSYEKWVTKIESGVLNLAGENLSLTAQTAQQESVLRSHEAFMEALAEAYLVAGRATGKVDTASFLKLLSAQQSVVAGERSFSQNVDAATETVRAAAADMESRLSEVASSGAGSVAAGIEVLDYTPFNTARRALDDVGGARVGLRSADIVCDSAVAVACSSPEGHITVANRVMGKGYEFLRQLMMHEYAHQVQFRSKAKMEASENYQSLFGEFGDDAFEAAADCMAQARIAMPDVGYDLGCTADQLAWGKGAWQGRW